MKNIFIGLIVGGEATGYIELENRPGHQLKIPFKNERTGNVGFIKTPKKIPEHFLKPNFNIKLEFDSSVTMLNCMRMSTQLGLSKQYSYIYIPKVEEDGFWQIIIHSKDTSALEEFKLKVSEYYLYCFKD